MEFLRMLEGIRTPLGETVFMILTYGGEELMLFGLILVSYWCVDKKLGYRMVFSYLPSALAINVLKLTCRVERPWVRDPSFTAVEKAKASATGYSFPSGHTQNATALFSTLAYVSKKTWQKLLFFLIIPLVMLSRMYLGVHTPADVLTSFAISIVIVIGMNLLADRLTLTHKRRLIIMCVMLVIAMATCIYTYVLYSSGVIAYKDASDSFKGCGAGMAVVICWVIETRYINFDTKCRNIWMQLLKLLIGVAVALLIKEGIKHGFNALFGQTFFTDVFRYFLLMTWAMIGMPLLIKKFFQVNTK